MDNTRLSLALIALLGFVGALVSEGTPRTLCLIAALVAAVAGVVHELRSRRTRHL